MSLIILKSFATIDFVTVDVIVFQDYIMLATVHAKEALKLSDDTTKDKLMTQYDLSEKQWQQILDAVQAGHGDTDTSCYFINFYERLYKASNRDAQVLHDFVVETKNPELALRFCREHFVSEDLKQIILDSNDLSCVIGYCEYIDSDDADMRQAVINTGNPERAYDYCSFTGKKNDEDMKQVIIDSDNHDIALMYCKYLDKDEDIKQVVLKSGDLGSILDYCAEISDDDDMRQVLIDAGDAEQALTYCIFVKPDDDMRQVIINSNDPFNAFRYCDLIGYDPDMRNIIMSEDALLWNKDRYPLKKFQETMQKLIRTANDPEWAVWYYKVFKDNLVDDGSLTDIILNAKDPQWIELYRKEVL